MSIESWALFGAMVLGLLHLTAASFRLQGAGRQRLYDGAARRGPPALGDRRTAGAGAAQFPRDVRDLRRRRADAEVGRRTGGALSETGALIYLGGRVIFLPLYALGVPALRSLSWTLATAGW